MPGGSVGLAPDLLNTLRHCCPHGSVPSPPRLSNLLVFKTRPSAGPLGSEEGPGLSTSGALSCRLGFGVTVLLKSGSDIPAGAEASGPGRLPPGAGACPSNWPALPPNPTPSPRPRLPGQCPPNMDYSNPVHWLSCELEVLRETLGLFFPWWTFWLRVLVCVQPRRLCSSSWDATDGR